MGKKHKKSQSNKTEVKKSQTDEKGEFCKYEDPNTKRNIEEVEEFNVSFIENASSCLMEQKNATEGKSDLSVNKLLDSLKLGRKSNPVKQQQKYMKFRNYYLHYICQVCKKVISSPDRCDKCQMIAYCSKEHRRQHWAIHADLCSAVQETRVARNSKHILEGTTNKDFQFFKNFCYNLMRECETRVQRKLENWEVELFLYPNVCETCFQWNTEVLTSCEICHHRSYCKPDHQNPEHRNYCESLKQYYEMKNYKFLHGYISVEFPSNFPEQAEIPGNIDLALQSSKRKLTVLEYLQLSDVATAPMTALYAYNQFQRTSNHQSKTEIIIHVVGAEKYFEIDTLQKWEVFFLHYLHELERLTVTFIGPELEMNEDEIFSANNTRLCKKCVDLKRKLNFNFIRNTLYHDYAVRKGFQKPTLICVFNAGMYRLTGYNEEDTWKDTIVKIFSWKNLPVLITEYTSEEAEQDLQRIATIEKVHTLIPPTQNPFSSRCPSLNFVSYQKVPVIYKNYYMLLLEKM